MVKPIAYLGQAATYALFAGVVGYFSAYPKYQHFPEDQALLKLSFSHAGQHKAECRQRTPEELAKLPPNMRAPTQCARERSPVTVRIDLDGKQLYQEALPPSGLSKDNVSTVYRRFPVPAGSHQLRVQLNDSVRIAGYNYNREEIVSLQPRQVMVIDFDHEKGGIILR